MSNITSTSTVATTVAWGWSTRSTTPWTSTTSQTTPRLLYSTTGETFSSDETYESDWPPWKIGVIVGPMVFLILEIILGNLLVIVAILTQRPLRTPSNMIILSLAFADLAVGVFILPFNIADMVEGWKFGVTLCRIWLTSDVTLCSTSILHISAIAVDRFRSINEGVQYAQSRTIRMSLVVCAALWLIALWIASSPVLGWNDWDKEIDNCTIPEDLPVKPRDETSPEIVCALTRELGYIIHSASGAFFIPAAIMVGLYVRIFLLIRNKLRERAQIACVTRRSRAVADEEQDNNDPPVEREQSSGDLAEDPSTDATRESIKVVAPKKKSLASILSTMTLRRDSTSTSNGGFGQRKKHSEQIDTILKNKLRFSLTKERKAAKTLGILIGAFIICWAPFTLCYLTTGVMSAINKERNLKCDDEIMVPFWFFQTVTWLGYVNSGINPIIYTIYNPEFRRAFTIILNHLRCKTS